jgi:hypothetical protein
MGTGVIIGLMAVMKSVVNLNDGIILGIVMGCFTLLVILEAILSWLLISSWRAAKGESRQVEERTTSELKEAPVRMLQEPPISVTEHTTRAFEPVFHERK